MNIDKINLAIIKHLRSGRKSYKKIAEQLSVSENTVRARVQKLIDHGILEITGLVDPEAINGHRIVMVGVKLKTMDLVNKGEEFSKVKGVISVSVVTGRFDLILMVLLKTGFGLLTDPFAREESSSKTRIIVNRNNKKSSEISDKNALFCEIP